jgi:lipopolysaccharide export system protein LptA
MQITVKRLRLWILSAAGLLVVVLAGFFLYSLLRFRREVKDLPRELGANIQQTANGFTYSQSSGGHTLFTIQASKLKQFRNGQALLHKVKIILYGPPGTHRQDTIHGTDFRYNPKTGVAQSRGEVQIDVQSPAQPGQAGVTNTIHVKTSGLTFDSKTGEATTSRYTEFASPKGSGHAVGASYNSKTGLLVLESSVFLQATTQKGAPVQVQAAHLSFQRDQEQALLTDPVLHSPQQTASAQSATLYFRKDGTADRLTALGQVHITTASGAVVKARAAQAMLDANSQPRVADLNGSVGFGDHTPQQAMHGTAGSAQLTFATFGANRLLQHALLRNAVNVTTVRIGLPGGGTATRHLQGQTLNIAFAPAPGGRRSIAKTVQIDHGARIALRTLTPHQPPQHTVIQGDHLVAQLIHGNTLRVLDGTGHTQVSTLGKDGARNTTQSDSLHVTFAAAPPPRKSSTAKAAQGAELATSQIQRAIASGHVVMHQQPAPPSQPGKQVQPVTAWAQQATYRANEQTVQLRGRPRLQQGASFELTANAIDYRRATGHATAQGNVKATYRRLPGRKPVASTLGNPQEPAHVIAERAEFFQSRGRAIFYGTPSNLARMWQGGDSVWAPVIELDQKAQQLQAHGSGTAPVVQTYFTAALGSNGQVSVVRAHSRSLNYSEKSRTADFSGDVEAIDAMGTLHASTVRMQLAPPSSSTGKSAVTELQRMIAQGGVTLTQPGREAVGTRLVYTGSDERFVLTGTPRALPYLDDRAHGRTTGHALIFNNRDDSVEIIGGKGSTVTPTRVPR